MVDASDSLLLVGIEHSVVDDMKDLLSNQYYSDVLFLVGCEKTIFKAHRCILAIRCEAFKHMFNDVVDNKDPISLPGMAAETFSAVLQFLYTNQCTIAKKDVISLLSTSLELEITDLIQGCTRHIQKTLTVETACQIMQVADTFGLDCFKRSLLPFFRAHTKEIFSTSGFQELSEETLAYILGDDELSIDEYDIVKAVESWTLINSAAFSVPCSEVARKVVGNIRLPLLTSKQLAEIECSNMKTHFIPAEQLSAAWKHIALKTPLNSTLEMTPRKGTQLHTR